jgi:hypothetical protein
MTLTRAASADAAAIVNDGWIVMFAIDPMDYDHYVGAQRRHRMKLSPRVTPMDPPSIGFFLPAAGARQFGVRAHF